MDLMLELEPQKLPQPISHRDKIMLTGSCFTEHIGKSLLENKFRILQNPNGILFDPRSVSKSLLSYISPTVYAESDLFYLNELWQCWDHHSRFSGTEKEEVLGNINTAQRAAHDFLKNADWLIVTLGSSFSYGLIEKSMTTQPEKQLVANCHRAPAGWFEKKLQPIDEIISSLDNCIHQLFHFNKNLRIIFTVSPVRHIRDGVIENNRSKARLIEAIHHITGKFDRLYYFPAYELVIDVLRDYRFYDIDLVHPNYLATQFVVEKFINSCISDESRKIIDELRTLTTAKKHRAQQPTTEAHKKFMASNHERAKLLQEKYTFIDLSEEILYFREYKQ